MAEGIRQEWLSSPRRRDGERLDPHTYMRGVNGLTVEEAVKRAHPRVVGILERSGEQYSEFEVRMVGQAIRAAIIAQVSRANLYRIAGILVADRRDEGAFADRSLAHAYVGAIRSAFLGDFAVGEGVDTPLGVGEVRYISQDGHNVIVALEEGRKEVWLPSGVVVRISPEDRESFDEGMELQAS